MAPSGAVSLRGHEDVLAQRREMSPAQRAAVGRRFPVLGSPQLPPPDPGQLTVAHLQSIASHLPEPLSSRRVDQRLTRILAETGRYRIVGLLRLPPEGYRSRLSDYLNAPERSFLSLTDVEITPLDGEGPARQLPFMALSVAHVVLVANADDQAS